MNEPKVDITYTKEELYQFYCHDCRESWVISNWRRRIWMNCPCCGGLGEPKEKKKEQRVYFQFFWDLGGTPVLGDVLDKYELEMSEVDQQFGVVKVDDTHFLVRVNESIQAHLTRKIDEFGESCYLQGPPGVGVFK